MIVIINGPLGVGKTDVSWALIKKFDKAVMLDGDFLGAVHPFEIYDPRRVEYLYRTITHLVEFHYRNGNCDIVVNYVFEQPESLNRLVDLLRPVDGKVHTFRLTASEEAMTERVRNRGRSNVEWELKRFRELSRRMGAPDVCNKLGCVIDTSDLDVKHVAQKVFEMAHADPSMDS